MAVSSSIKLAWQVIEKFKWPLAGLFENSFRPSGVVKWLFFAALKVGHVMLLQPGRLSLRCLVLPCSND